MYKNCRIPFLWIIGIQTIACLLFSSPTLPAQEDPHLFFLAFTGEAVGGKAPVLLRWFSFDGSIPVQSFSIFRKEGDASSTQPLTLLSVTSRIRNEPLIRSIFEQPTQSKALRHIQEVLSNILEAPVTNDTYVKHLLAVLDANCEECDFRRSMLINANYGVAIVEGLGYLDPVPPGIYTYELRTSKSGGGTDDLVIGRITIDATKPTKLPPPQQPEVVDVSGDKGDKRIFLYWNTSPELKERRIGFFAYNVYRAEEDASGEDYYTLLNSGRLKKVNRLPIIPPSSQALGTKPEDRYVFVDDNLTYTSTGQQGIPLNPGDAYTYWVTPIDLLGQDGDPSLPVVGVVPDKSAPYVPRGLATHVIEMGGVKRIALTWERNTDDAVGYKVYRFRLWDHVGKRDVFPPVDGLTEGYVADVAQPVSDAPLFTDTMIDGAQFENDAFWYCVSAFDDWSNESALSPPYRGIIFDTKPPEAPSTVQICTTSFLCQMTIESLVPLTDSVPVDNSRVAVVLTLKRPQPTEESLRVEIKRVVTCTNPELIPPADKILFDNIFDASGTITVRDDFPRPESYITITYWITTFLDGQQVCQAFTIPDSQYKPAFDDYLHSGVSVSITASLRVGTEYRCEPVTTGEKPHEPYDDYGNIKPVVFDVAQSEDAAGVILYRSPDCENYYPVDEFQFGTLKSLKAKDLFTPDQGGRICYGVRYYDENHNLSPIYYIPINIKFPSSPTTQVVPSMISVDPLGDLTAPGMALSWFGSDVGLAGFRVEISDATDFSGTLRTVLLGPSDYTFVATDNEFRTSLDEIDDKTKEKIQIDKTYHIRVVARLQNGQERTSNNFLKFIWAADKTQHEHPNWPVRPLPPISPDLRAAWMPRENFETPFDYGVVIDIGYYDYQDNVNREHYFYFTVEAPFVVYRKRIDIPDKTYIQISPLIDRILISDNELVGDPFIHYIYGIFRPEEYNVAYLDTVDLIEGARYEYKIVKLNEKTGEIERVYGPSNPVEVINP